MDSILKDYVKYPFKKSAQWCFTFLIETIFERNLVSNKLKLNNHVDYVVSDVYSAHLEAAILYTENRSEHYFINKYVK